jgi:hypothetical protein
MVLAAMSTARSDDHRGMILSVVLEGDRAAPPLRARCETMITRARFWGDLSRSMARIVNQIRAQ